MVTLNIPTSNLTSLLRGCHKVNPILDFCGALKSKDAIAAKTLTSS